MLTPASQPKDASEVEYNPLHLIIDFSLFQRLCFKARDIQYCRLKGWMNASHELNTANVVSSEFVDFHAHGTTWHRTDVKDCALKDVEIVDSNLDFTSWLNDVFIGAAFTRVIFTHTVITDCTFMDSSFEDCDLSHMLVKRCRFANCRFTRCRTSNKLMEASVLRDTRFDGTDLELATIFENYGLSSALCSAMTVFVDRPGQEAANPALLWEQAHDERLLPIQRLKLAYFVNRSLPAELLDEALDISSWLPLCRVPSSFAVILDGFASFLLDEFNDERLVLSPLLRLYTAARQLSSTLASLTETALRAEFEAAIAAAALKLLPPFEEHLLLVQALSRRSLPRIQFLAEGPTEPEFFQSFLREVLGEEAAFRVESVVPQNSPSILTVLVENETTLATLVSIFLASRLRFELSKVQLGDLLGSKPALGPEAPAPATSLPVPSHQKLIAFDVGMDEGERLVYHLRAYALFPQGIAAVLRLDIGLGLVTKVRQVLLDLLRPRKAGENAETRKHA
jgi:uncharacterized protein YjbI with pentapeptide repeats